MARDKGYLAKIGADVSGFQEAMKTIKQETSSIKKELSQVNHALKMDPGNTTLMTQKLELLKQQADAAEKELTELARAKQVMERVGNDGTQEGAAALREYQREVERCKRHIQEFSKYQQQVGSSVNGISNIADGANTVAESITEASGATNIWAGVLKGNLLSGAIMQGLDQLLNIIKQIGTEIVTTGRGFDTAMSQVAATIGIDKTTEEYNALAVAAQHMGATTKYTAAQAAEALNYLAQAGYSSKESIADLPQVLSLAQAGGMELGQTSDLLTNSMAALGLVTEDMNENMKAEAMREFSDQMAKTAQRAGTDVQKLSDGIITVGASARGLRDGTAELNLLLGALADIGIKGSEGGTHLRNILVTLRENADVFEEMGVSVYDLEGNLNYLPDIFSQLNDAMDGMSAAERDNTILDIFNRTDLAAINGLLGTSTERFEELSAAIHDSEGTCAEMAQTMNDNLDGAILSCTAALESLSLAINDSIKDDMQGAVEEVTKVLFEMRKGILGGEDETFDPMQVDEYVSKATEYIMSFSASLRDKVNTIGMELLPTLFEAVNENIQDVSMCAGDIVVVFVQGLVNSLPHLVDGAFRLVAGLAEGIGEALPELIPVCLDVIGNIADNLVDNIDIIYQSALALIEGLGEALSNPETLESLATAAGKIVVALFEALIYSVDLAVNIIFDVIDALAKGMARGVTDYDWSDFGDKMVEEVGAAIADAFKKMTAIKIPFVATAEIEYKNLKGETVTTTGLQFTSSTNPDDWASLLSEDEYNKTFGVVSGPDTSTLGTAYLESLTQKTQTELQDLQREIIIERNKADEAWASFVSSGYGNIEVYLAKTKSALTEEQQTVLQGIVDVAKAASITEAEAYEQLYKSGALADGSFSDSYLRFQAVQDVLIAGTYAAEPVVQKSSNKTYAVESVVSTQYDEQIEAEMKLAKDRLEIDELTEEEYYKKRKEILQQYYDDKSKIWHKHNNEVQAYYAKKRDVGKYDEDIETEMDDLSEQLQKHQISEAKYYKERQKVLEKYVDRESVLWHKHNDEVTAYFEEQAKKGKNDDEIVEAIALFDDRLSKHKLTEAEYYAAREEMLKTLHDEDSALWWKYRDENDAYYAKQAEETLKAMEEAQKEEEEKQKEIQEQREKQLQDSIKSATDNVKDGKTNKDVVLIQQGISELQGLLTTISTESDAYEDCLNAIENGNKELADLQKSLSDAELTAQIEDIEYRKEINARTQSDLQTTKQYYEELKTFVESIQGTDFYDGKARDFERKLYNAEKAYNDAYVKAYTEDVKAQIAILDDIKADIEDSTVGDNWYLEQLNNIIKGIDNADVAQAFEAQLTKAREQVDKNAEAVEKSILQAAQKYQGAIEYFRNGETLDGKDGLIINDLTKQREQVQNVIKGMQALRDRGFSDAYLNDAVESLSVQDGSRQKAIEALLGLSDEQVQQELQDYEGLKADMLELARVENDVQSQEIADSAVLTANNALSQAIAEAYKIGKDTADSFNRGILDGLGSGLNAQQALTAQGIDVLKSANSTVNAGNTVVTEKPNTTVVVNVAGTEVIRKTVDGMLRENIINGGNNLHI